MLVKQYIKPLMQLLSAMLSEYNMRLVQTKCLNTAVMFMYLFFGHKALSMTQYCDVRNVVYRHTSLYDDNIAIVERMKKDILKQASQRYVYYVMLTDGEFRKPDGTKVFFPGHVFIIEKVPCSQGQYYHIYQSYINKYTFAEYVDKHKTIKVSQQKVQYYLESVMRMVKSKTWDNEFRKFWNQMTKVDTPEMVGSHARDAFYVCYKRKPYSHCLKHLRALVEKGLASIPKQTALENTVYGDHVSYDDLALPLTNKQMQKQLQRLKSRIEMAKG